ncbi:MAG: 2-dehydropantoate 2-reductase [Gemmatimonadota bacterium]|nr:2-dehydropantoate 2-reductase [Gemmatimonadota bacterium]
MRIVVVGAGGLGSYIGGVLDQAGHEVTLVARGDHRAIIESDGLRVKSHAGDFVARPACVGSGLELEGAELAFLATKTFSLDDVAPQLVHLAARGSAVVSLLNGVTARRRLAAAGIPAEKIADGVAYMTAFRLEPGVVERKAAHQRIVVGDGAVSERVLGAFADTIVQVEVADDVDVELWEKMAVVCPLTVLCAIGDRNMGSVRRHPFGAELQRAAIGEVLSVGRAYGVAIPTDANARIDERLDRFPDDFFPSVIHDLNSGRRTEMDDLGGTIARMGRELGVPTPLHDAGTLIVQRAELASG